MQKILQEDVLLRQTRKSAGKEKGGVQFLRSEEENPSTRKKILLTSISATYTPSRRDTDSTPSASKHSSAPRPNSATSATSTTPPDVSITEEEHRGIAVNEGSYVFVDELWEGIFNDGARAGSDT